MARGKNIDTGGNIDTEGQNIFPEYTACKSRTINCMAQEGNNKDTEVKIKDTRGKILCIFPQLKYADTVTKKDCVQWENMI